VGERLKARYVLAVAILVAAVSAGCASLNTPSQHRSLVTPSVTQRPADDAPVSQILQDAFFTNSVASGGQSYTRIDELGPRMRQFHPERDGKLVFVGVFSTSYSGSVRGVLFRPDGRQHGTLTGDVSSRPGGGRWQSKSWTWAMVGLKPYQGEWQLRLWLDEQPMGSYYFMLGNPAAASATVGTPPLSKPMSLTPPASSPAIALVPASGVKVPIQILEDLIFVPVMLNRSHGATFLLDTGAQYTVLTPALAGRLGIPVAPDAPTKTVAVVGGQKITIPFVRLSLLELGTSRIEDIEVGVYAVAPESTFLDGILGGDILGRFAMTLDRTARQLLLAPAR